MDDIFDWDDWSADHIAEYLVSTDEAEEAMLDPSRVSAPAYQLVDERRRAILGATGNGRVLFVVFTSRGRRIRVVTARDATSRERRRYRR